MVCPTASGAKSDYTNGDGFVILRNLIENLNGPEETGLQAHPPFSQYFRWYFADLTAD